MNASLSRRAQVTQYAMEHCIPVAKARLDVRAALDRMCQDRSLAPIIAYEQAVRRLEALERQQEAARREMLDAHNEGSVQ